MNTSNVMVTQTSIDPTSTRILVDAELTRFFALNIANAEKIDSQYATLWKTIQTLMMAGGKRLRPYVTLMTFQAFSDEPIEAIIPAASAQELLHLSLLIHDDIIDRDQIRYGIPNISGQYDMLYSSVISDSIERRHFSDSAALLAGDLLVSGSYQLIQSSRLNAQQIKVASDVIAQAIFTVAGGELLDTESSFRQSDTVDAITIATYKTAHYSFVTPLTMGARLADVDDDTVVKLQDFGKNVGIAYQLVDDFLGIFGSSDVTGKSNTTDIEEAKQTYLIEQLHIHGTLDQQKKASSLLGKKNITPNEATLFQSILIDSGAKQATEDAITRYADEALTILSTINLSNTARQHFESLVDRATKRDK